VLISRFRVGRCDLGKKYNAECGDSEVHGFSANGVMVKTGSIGDEISAARYEHGGRPLKIRQI